MQPWPWPGGIAGYATPGTHSENDEGDGGKGDGGGSGGGGGGDGGGGGTAVAWWPGSAGRTRAATFEASAMTVSTGCACS